MKKSGNTVLVTGGSKGIGRELARRLHDLGNVVIISGRDAAGLKETIGDRANMHAMTFDAADAADTERFAAELIEAFPAFNLLINNAGIMTYEALAVRRDLRVAEDMIATNLLGPIRLTNAVIDHLVSRPDAAIVNVTSGLAFVPRASAATYSATKAAIHSYTVALRVQLEGKVEVIELVPPMVQTELTPGQTNNPIAMPLQEFIDETMSLLSAEPTAPEILVQRVQRQRFAERNGNFEEILQMIAKR